MSHAQNAFHEDIILAAGKRSAKLAVAELTRLIRKNDRFKRALSAYQAVAVKTLNALVSLDNSIPPVFRKKILKLRKRLDYSIARRDETLIKAALKSYDLSQEKQILERAITICAESIPPHKILITHQIMDAEKSYFTTSSPVPASKGGESLPVAITAP